MCRSRRLSPFVGFVGIHFPLQFPSQRLCADEHHSDPWQPLFSSHEQHPPEAGGDVGGEMGKGVGAGAGAGTGASVGAGVGVGVGVT